MKNVIYRLDPQQVTKSVPNQQEVTIDLSLDELDCDTVYFDDWLLLRLSRIRAKFVKLGTYEYATFLSQEGWKHKMRSN